MKDLAAPLAARRAAGLYRQRRRVGSPQAAEIEVDGRRLLAFCSNDYLGLAAHPQIAAALARGAERWGTGAGAAHLISGHSRAHEALEEALAEFVGAPRALLFSTGYMANLGVISALAGRGDRVFEDRLNHASLLDGARLGGARLLRYRHADAADLEARLAAAGSSERLVASDGVFSMDGDLAPLPALLAAARRHDARLLVDDAHGLGVLGPGGRGSLAHAGLVPETDDLILVGTLGKAFGTFGAFVAGSEALIETLIQQARPYIYTTAPPPALAEATLASLALVQGEDWRRERLRALIARLRAGAAELGLPLMDSTTPVQPLLVGEAGAALALSEQLLAAGILVPAIRPPTVPEGSARLRISLSAAHSEAQVDTLLAALDAAGAGRVA
ncbi:8-amino-7-oxononanoate synthase [Thiohalobacter sp. IOR34]|uniref:8-amino-7-oxononanoate synthase n=1 Tax=Thiohalobacter sp. IOR34 TaxID=3057176 RepID=UPI0025B1661D|nr:8-amino-7-oxononanoate synthase [Thiohalobacter sp. IOR34]WJW75725.1 8-amino-7-oxononanoate synthase [Thiohalobacter sp. IOR34]